jgi:hypothetical protein
MRREARCWLLCRGSLVKEGWFMGLLVQCQRCGTLFGDCVCPKCGSVEVPAEFQRQCGIIEEFRQRKLQFEFHQAISIGLTIGLVATATALLVLVWITRFWEGMLGSVYDVDAFSRNTVLAGILGCFAVLLSLLCFKSRAWWPVELMCPVCNFRLDHFQKPVVFCPHCAAYLGSARPGRGRFSHRRRPTSERPGNPRAGSSRNRW